MSNFKNPENFEKTHGFQIFTPIIFEIPSFILDSINTVLRHHESGEIHTEHKRREKQTFAHKTLAI